MQLHLLKCTLAHPSVDTMDITLNVENESEDGIDAEEPIVKVGSLLPIDIEWHDKPRPGFTLAKRFTDVNYKIILVSYVTVKIPPLVVSPG